MAPLAVINHMGATLTSMSGFIPATGCCSAAHALRLLLLVCCLWAGPATVVAGAADGWVRNLEVLVDAEGRHDLASAQAAQDWQAAPHGFSAGYTRKAHWLRFELDAPPPDPDGLRELLLEIHPPYLDELLLYIPRGDEVEFVAFGDRIARSQWHYPHRAFLYPVLFRDGQPLTLYLRLKTSSSSVLHVRAWRVLDFAAHTQLEYLLLGGLMALLVAGVVANLLNGLWRRDVLFRDFLLYLLANIGLIGSINGLFGQYLLPDWPAVVDHITSLSALLVIAMAARFYTHALKIAEAGRLLRGLYATVFWLALLLLPSPLLGFFTEAIRGLTVLGLLMLLAGTARSAWLWRRGAPGSKPLLAAHVFSLLGSASAALTLLGVLPGQFPLIYGFQIGTLGNLVALQILLSGRVRALEQAHGEALLASSQAETRAEQERLRLEEQRHFLAMLTHELRSPLAVLRLRLGAEQPSPRMAALAEQAVAEIDRIIDRCALAARVDDGAIVRNDQPLRLADLVAEVVDALPEEDRPRIRRAGMAQAPELVTDPLLLRVVLSNLLENALKYGPKGGEVWLNLYAGRAAEGDDDGGPPGVTLSVGNPVGPAGRPDPGQVFDRYYRAAAARSRSGSGLGLFIVRALATMLGGRIRYVDLRDEVCFELWLPLTTTHLPASAS